MPHAPVPPELDEFLARPNPAVMASVRHDGAPHTAATWYDWEGGRALLNFDAGRLRLDYVRRDPHVSLTVLDDANWYRHVTLMGVVEDVAPDPDLVDIDRLSTRYTGQPYGDRVNPRVSGWLLVVRWHAWDTAGPMDV